MATKSEILAEVPLFALLGDQERGTLLAERVAEAKLAAGTLLFNYGDPGGSMFVVRSGAVELFFKNDTGDEIVLETMRAGQFFGDISLLDGDPRNVSARVIEDVEALVVHRGDLDEFLKLHPAAAMDLLAATGRRRRETARRLRHTGA